ncbi:MAG: PDZ domain-containing protein [Flavobacteriales bacterium]|nr:PDZ domain-containing protein [Flavobacteriales bacterium]
MKYKLFCFFVFLSVNIFAQSGFILNANKEKIEIPFQFINNLIFIPITVNEVELTFLLDSGVDETILFSLEEKENIIFQQVEKVKLKGLGSADFVEGLKSSNNKVQVNVDFFDISHTIYIILEENINISSSVGIPVNGIIGYHFFKKYPIQIDYDKNKITVFKEDAKRLKKLKKKFVKVDITLENNKPYLELPLKIEDKILPSKLLFDTGNSDAFWFFQSKIDSTFIPTKHYIDFLGQGFSGAIYGKRAKVNFLEFDQFSFQHPMLAFPDSSSIKHVRLVKDRIGSVGAELIKRFNVIIDYKNLSIHLKKNHYFSSPFFYNRSGLEIHHAGLKWVSQKMPVNGVNFNTSMLLGGAKKMNSITTVYNADQEQVLYKFVLKPIYIISEVRENSPAEISGLKKGDMVKKINGIDTLELSLQEINTLLRSNEDKRINLEIEREGKLMLMQFYLTDLL